MLETFCENPSSKMSPVSPLVWDWSLRGLSGPASYPSPPEQATCCASHGRSQSGSSCSSGYRWLQRLFFFFFFLLHTWRAGETIISVTCKYYKCRNLELMKWKDVLLCSANVSLSLDLDFPLTVITIHSSVATSCYLHFIQEHKDII